MKYTITGHCEICRVAAVAIISGDQYVQTGFISYTDFARLGAKDPTGRAVKTGGISVAALTMCPDCAARLEEIQNDYRAELAEFFKLAEKGEE